MAHFVYDDGGRLAAGFVGVTRDCVTRAIAIATGIDYRTVYNLVNEAGKRERRAKHRKNRSTARGGFVKGTTRRILSDLGWVWTPTMKFGEGCRVHLRADELPSGRIICKLSKHIVAVIDGVIHDTHDPSRDGTRCVYGYWRSPETA